MLSSTHSLPGGRRVKGCSGALSKPGTQITQSVRPRQEDIVDWLTHLLTQTLSHEGIWCNLSKYLLEWQHSGAEWPGRPSCCWIERLPAAYFSLFPLQTAKFYQCRRLCLISGFFHWEPKQSKECLTSTICFVRLRLLWHFYCLYGLNHLSEGVSPGRKKPSPNCRCWVRRWVLAFLWTSEETGNNYKWWSCLLLLLLVTDKDSDASDHQYVVIESSLQRHCDLRAMC